ncbi:hypothetical protein E2562_014307 [Oryza meyeriana var. granulata]|uniref:Uncharacterized protein n=1 Tax=Oryza meyeriana var. granulata TaxID=110450 RepID=A0A6G1C5F2_9ORYZ|nr:hypothetical protein E2562_014307 [Oryza meyeriana var. granulata]
MEDSGAAEWIKVMGQDGVGRDDLREIGDRHGHLVTHIGGGASLREARWTQPTCGNGARR